MSETRGKWGSHAAFILAAAGSAVGIGNIWRFPTMTGRSGGAAFVVIYLACVVLVGLPIMVAELAIGRRTERNPVGAFQQLVPGSWWRWVGLMGVLTGIAILSYYSVIAGWTLGYVFKTAGGAFTAATGQEAITAAFNGLVSSPVSAIGLLSVFMVLTMAVVAGGVEAGIERWSKVLMPILFVLLLLLVGRAVTLPGASAGLEFYLRPDFSKVTGATVLAALGQAFFSLSLGMGAMITYGSYLKKRERLFRSAVFVCLADTSVALLAGLAIFPALFTIPGLQPSEGPALVFLVLPNIFAQIPGGVFFGTGFFLLLVIAALTSAISLLEVVVAFGVDEMGWSRSRATMVFGTVAFVLGIPSALSAGAVSWLSALPGIGVSFLDAFDMVFGNFSLTLGALLLSLFVGWRWGVAHAFDEVRFGEMPAWIGAAWSFLIRFLCPVAIALILFRVVAGALRG